jgi:hypothetical protein
VGGEIDGGNVDAARVKLQVEQLGEDPCPELTTVSRS